MVCPSAGKTGIFVELFRFTRLLRYYIQSVLLKQDKMIDIFQNPFSNSNFQSARQTVGVSSPSKITLSVQSSPSVSSSWNIKDEYVPSVSSFSSSYKRSSIATVPFKMSEEPVRSEEITDPMRAELKSGDGYWSAIDLLPVAYPAFYEIIQQVYDEKGISEVIATEGWQGTFTWGINPDGTFIFHPDSCKISEIDTDFAEEICVALESALNSSSLNIKETPHLFMKPPLPVDYDPAEWGRTIDREEWSINRDPDFSGFIEELRSDIFKEYDNLQIVDFSIKINDQGKLTITDVKTEGNNPKINAQVVERMNSRLTDEIKKKAEYLGLLMLSAHNAINGDVLTKGTILEPFDDGSIGDIPQFKHEVVITSDSDYKVISSNGRSKL
ncbi:MAG: hypothetical protein LBC02_05630 [Planctomycetaceae bacterium]|jgi:hypothetical protein|nr:hypothetical protein [Planctomycetaceae bacterium]